MIAHGVILAAGQSKRLGQAKQLVPYQGRSLLQHIEHTLTPLLDQLYVVLGHDHQKFQPLIQAAQIVINPNWSEGMGGSLRWGIQAAAPGADVILVALCDQPKIPAQHYRSLLHQAFTHPDSLVATGHGESPGVPAVFQRPHFQALLQHGGELGAKKWLQSQVWPLITVPCTQASFDVDTPHHLDRLDP